MLVMFMVGWYNVSVVQTGCVNTISNSCGADASNSLFNPTTNPLAFVLSGISSTTSNSTTTSPTNTGPVSTTQAIVNSLTGAWNWLVGAFTATVNTVAAVVTTGSVASLITISGFAMIIFAIFGNTQVAGSGLNMADSTVHMLLGLGFMSLLYGFLGVLALPLLVTIPWAIGSMMFGGLTFIFYIGAYDYGRTVV